MSSVIVTVSTPTDPSRLPRVYSPVVGTLHFGADSATVELSLDRFRTAIIELNLKFIGTVNWRVVETVKNGEVNLAFGYVRQHDRPVETMELLFEESDMAQVREILAQISLLDGLDAFDGA